VFPDVPIGLLHGRLPAAEKEAAMDAFKNGRTKILVSTTVIEVGVDVPNATVMIIEQAERFGLSQLHQLRGRVGRGAAQSYCMLITTRLNDTGKERIRTMVDSTDGFKIAEMDRNEAVGAPLAADRQHPARSRHSERGEARSAGVCGRAAFARSAGPRGRIHQRPLAAALRPGAGRIKQDARHRW
jgi:superfamily II DNA or RNA helicase